MRELSEAEIEFVGGGLNLSGLAPTEHAVNRTLNGYMNRYGMIAGARMWMEREMMGT